MKSTKESAESRFVILTLWLLVFAASSQVMIVAPIIPRIAEELHVGKSTLGLLITIYAVVVGLFALVAGPISDRYGRRRILLAGSGLLAITLGLHAVADNFSLLLTMRGFAGVAGGFLSGAVVSYIGDYFPVHRRGWASGWVMSGIAVGQVLGIPLGNLLADWFSFRTPFLAFSLLAALSFLFMLFKLPQPQVTLRTSLSFQSALGSYATLLRRREVRAAALAYMTMLMGFSLFETFFPTWLEEHFGFSVAMVSLLFMVGGVTKVIAGPQAGKLSDRIGRTRVIIGVAIGIALLLPLIILVQPSFFWVIYPLFCLMMICMAPRMVPIGALLTQLVSGEQRGAVMSLVTSTAQIGYGLGSALASLVWGVWGFTGNALLGMVSTLLTAGIVWRYLRKVELRMLDEEQIENEQTGETEVHTLPYHL